MCSVYILFFKELLCNLQLQCPNFNNKRRVGLWYVVLFYAKLNLILRLSQVMSFDCFQSKSCASRITGRVISVAVSCAQCCEQKVKNTLIVLTFLSNSSHLFDTTVNWSFDFASIDSLGKLVFPCQRVNARWGKLDCKDRACDLEGTSSFGS